MTFNVREKAGHFLSTSRLAEIRSAAESLLLSNEKKGALAVADALIEASAAMSYNVRAQFAIDLSKACISKGKRALFEDILGVLLSQDPLSADEAVDDLDFALDAAEDDDTFVDVKPSNRSNMHSRHTHHHLGLTMASLSTSAKDWCLRALRDSNTLMYPKAALLLCSFQRDSPVAPDSEIIALASDHRTIPRLVRIIMAACMKHKRTAVCDALALHFWSCHYRDRCALLLPFCSASFLRKFLSDFPQVMTEKDFNIDQFLKKHADVSMDLFETKLKSTAPLQRDSLWAHGPFHQPHRWIEPMLQRNPGVHIRLASLVYSYPVLSILRTSGGFSEYGKPVTGFSSVIPTFPLCHALKMWITKYCKVKGKDSDFWKVWFPLLLDSVATQYQPVLREMSVLSAFDAEDARESATKSLSKLLSPEDARNEILVSCILRSHTSNEVNSFHQLDARKFDDILTAAKTICSHPKLSRSIYRDYSHIFDLPLSQDQYCVVLEKILSVAIHIEALSSNHSMDMISNLRLGQAYNHVVSHAGRSLSGVSKPLAVFTALHRFSLICFARLVASDSVKPSAPQQAFDAISTLWSEASRGLLSCLIQRALIHGDSSFAIDGHVVSNSMFLSQQLQGWLRLLHDEYWTQYIAAATATDRFQPSLGWKREFLEDHLSTWKEGVLLFISNIDLESFDHSTSKTFGFPVLCYDSQKCDNSVHRHLPHPSVLQVLVNFILENTTALVHKSTSTPFFASDLESFFPNFDTVSKLAAQLFSIQGACIESLDGKAKLMFETLDSLILQLGQYVAKQLSENFPREEDYVDAAATCIQACADRCSNFFSLVTFLRPVLDQLSLSFQSRNENPLQSSENTKSFGSAVPKLSEASVATVLRNICNIFSRKLGCFGSGYDTLQNQFRARRFSTFAGVSMEQHLMHGLQFLFVGCKTCTLLSSSNGLLYKLAIDILSTLCFRLKASDALYEPVMEYVKESMRSFSSVRRELVFCESLPGDVLNEIAWDFASNSKLPESEREKALSFLDLSDPSKKQEILQTKCRARTFELRLLGFKTLLKASIQTCHPQWASNFISAVQDIHSRTLNESVENLNSIYALVSANIEALQTSLEEQHNTSGQYVMLSSAHSADFQAIFSKIACSVQSAQIDPVDGCGSDCSMSSNGVQSGNGLSTLRKTLIKFSLFALRVMMCACQEEESRLPMQNWISFIMAVNYSEEAQENSDDMPCDIARRFVLKCELPWRKVQSKRSSQKSKSELPLDVVDLLNPRDAQLRKYNSMMQHYISCVMKAYEDLGSQYPNPDSDTVHLALHRDLSCLSIERLSSLMDMCDVEVWMRTDIVTCLLGHWHCFDMKSIDSEDLIYNCLMRHWFKSEEFEGAHHFQHSDKEIALVPNAIFTPIKEFDWISSDLHILTQKFLDAFILSSERAAIILPRWLAYFSMGTVALQSLDFSSLSHQFRKPDAQPHVESMLRLCPSSAYIPFVNRFMVRFAQHLIPSQFLRESPLSKENVIEGVFLPAVPQSKTGPNKVGRKVGKSMKKTGGSDAGSRSAPPKSILSVWMYSHRLHVRQTTRLKHQLLKTFCDASIGNAGRLKALRRATRLPSLSSYDVLKAVQPEFVAPPLQVAAINGFFAASLDFEDSSNISVTTLWKSQDSMSMYPDSVDRYMAGNARTLVTSGSYKCFVPIEVATDPTIYSLIFLTGAVAVDSIDAVVEAHISNGRLSDSDLCAGIERTFDSSQSNYEVYLAWSFKSNKSLDARDTAVKALLDQLVRDLSISCGSAVNRKRRLPLQSSSSSKSKPVFFRRVTFIMNENSEKLVRECFDDTPVNLFPRLTADISKAAIVACGYCSESTACLDTIYSPRFLASALSSAAVMLFERSSSVFPSGSTVKFAEKLLFRNSVFFPPKVTIQKAIVRLLTSNIDESNSGIIMRVFRRCRHISVLTLLIGTCLRLLRTPTKIDLGKRLMVEVLKIAIKAEKESIAAFSKFCEVSFLDIRSFLDRHRSWNTPTRQELTQEWDTKTPVAVDLDFLPWYMDNIIIPMAQECTNVDLRDFCIMARFCSYEAFWSSSNSVVDANHVADSNPWMSSYAIFTLYRAWNEIEAARSTYLRYILDELPAALTSDNLDTFHRIRTVATAAKEFVDNMMMTDDVVTIQLQCIQTYTSWIHELLPHLSRDLEIRFSMGRTQEIVNLVSFGVAGVERIRFDHQTDQSLSKAVLVFCEVASKVPGLDQKMRSKLLSLTWRIQVRSMLASSNHELFGSAAAVWRESLIHADSHASVLPYEATAFEEFLTFYLDQQDSWDTEAPADERPFTCALKLLLEKSSLLFISVCKSKMLASHIQLLTVNALSRFFDFHFDSSSAKRASKFCEMLAAVEAAVLNYLKAIVDWFHQQISSCVSSSLQDAAAFHSVLLLFGKVLSITKPAALPNFNTADAKWADRVSETRFYAIQRRIHSIISQMAPRMLESYIDKYYDTFSLRPNESDLPSWFASVKSLGSILTTAVEGARRDDLAVQTVQLSPQVAGDMPAPKWVANTPVSLFCLRIYLRLLSCDQLCANPSLVVSLINSLCCRSVLFEHDGDASSVFVPETHFEPVFEMIIPAATKYCVYSHQVLISVACATNDSLKETIRSINQLVCDEKSSQPNKRMKFQHDFQGLGKSLERTCSIFKRIVALFTQSVQFATPPPLYRDALVLHVTNLVAAALAIVSCEDLHQKHSNNFLQSIITDLPYFLKQQTAPQQTLRDIVASEAASNREFHRLLFSIISVPDTKFDTFQEDCFIGRVRMQDALNNGMNGEKLLLQLQRLEYLVRASQIMIRSHCGGRDPVNESVKLQEILRTLPSFFLNQFQSLWCEARVSHSALLHQKLRMKSAHEIAALSRDGATEFLASFQIGSVQSWFEQLTGSELPVPFLSLSNDSNLRPIVVSYFCRHLLMQVNNYANGPLPTELLTLCAPIAALGSAEDVIDLLRAVFRHHKNVVPSKDCIPILVKFFESLDTFQGLLESGGFSSAANVIFDARLLTCADFVSSNSDPVFVAALRIIIRSQTAPSMPEIQSVTSVPSGLQQPPLTAKQQSQKTAHLLGSILIPLIKQANSSDGLFNKSLGALFSVIYGAVVPGQTAARPIPRSYPNGRPVVHPASGMPMTDSSFAAATAKASPEQLKQMLGDRLYAHIVPTQPQLAGKITGKLLEGSDTASLLQLFNSPEALDERIKLTLEALQKHA